MPLTSPSVGLNICCTYRLALLCCAVPFTSSLHRESHCKRGTGSNVAFAISFQSWGIVLILIAQEVRICFIIGADISFCHRSFLVYFILSEICISQQSIKSPQSYSFGFLPAPTLAFAVPLTFFILFLRSFRCLREVFFFS